MKKISIIAVLLLSTGLTALSISRKTEKPDVKMEKAMLAEKTATVASPAVLATAD
nr:hypothetical protein [uncultured Mucilaginibacter sp.]